MQPLFTELKSFKKLKIDKIFSNPQFTYTHSKCLGDWRGECYQQYQ